MSVALMGLLLFAQQVEAICEPGGYEVEESDLIASVRYFVDRGNQRDFAAAASMLLPGAIGESDGETMLLIDAINRNIEGGEVDEDPTYLLDVMSAPGVVVAKATSGGEPAIVVFQMDGGCIARMTYFGS